MKKIRLIIRKRDMPNSDLLPDQPKERGASGHYQISKCLKPLERLFLPSTLLRISALRGIIPGLLLQGYWVLSLNQTKLPDSGFVLKRCVRYHQCQELQDWVATTTRQQCARPKFSLWVLIFNTRTWAVFRPSLRTAGELRVGVCDKDVGI